MCARPLGGLQAVTRPPLSTRPGVGRGSGGNTRTWAAHAASQAKVGAVGCASIEPGCASIEFICALGGTVQLQGQPFRRSQPQPVSTSVNSSRARQGRPATCVSQAKRVVVCVLREKLRQIINIHRSRQSRLAACARAQHKTGACGSVAAGQNEINISAERGMLVPVQPPSPGQVKCATTTPHHACTSCRGSRLCQGMTHTTHAHKTHASHF